MKNCPVVTDDVTITPTDLPRGAQLDVVADAAHLDGLRTETKQRIAAFPFTGARVTGP